ncbi:hypothetical protein ACMZ62_08795 [Streptococcus pluranimalium]
MNREDWIEYYETVYGQPPTDEVIEAARLSGEFTDEEVGQPSAENLLEEKALPLGEAEVTSNRPSSSPSVTSQENPAQTPIYKQKQFRLLGGVGLLVLSLLLGLFFLLRYQTGDIQGYWRSANLEKKLIKEIEKNLSEVEEGSDIKVSDVVKSETVALDVADDKAVMSVSYIFDKEAFYKIYEETMASSDYSSYLDDTYSALIESLLPSRSDIEDMIDDALEESAKEEGFDYDSETGKLEATLFEGKVKRISRTIEITRIENDELDLDDIDIDEGDELIYDKNKSDLILKGKNKKDDVIFKKGKISSSDTY